MSFCTDTGLLTSPGMDKASLSPAGMCLATFMIRNEDNTVAVRPNPMISAAVRATGVRFPRKLVARAVTPSINTLATVVTRGATSHQSRCVIASFNCLYVPFQKVDMENRMVRWIFCRLGRDAVATVDHHHVYMMS